MDQPETTAAPSSLNATPLNTIDQFTQSLRQALEHIDDAEWLQEQIPLASVYFTGVPGTATRAPQIALSGHKALDERLDAIWQQWSGREKTHLQHLVWDALCRLPSERESNFQATLLLTYFQEPRPKQSEVIKSLSLSRATYYRHLDQAVARLGTMLLHLLRPALQLETPLTRALVGRSEEREQAYALMRQGQVLHIIGGSGLGKTSLGAQLADRWGRTRTFWYTFRLHLSDHVEQLLFALGYFLHRLGASTLWLQLTLNPRQVKVENALAIIRQSLEELRSAPPCFCFDEVDLLLSSDVQQQGVHAQVRAVLDALVQSPRYGAPIILIGQKMLLEPETGHLFLLHGLNQTGARAILQQAGIELSPEHLLRLVEYTQGNPLLLRLFATWQRVAGAAQDAIEQLSIDVSIEWFLMRLQPHLSAREREVLDTLSVYPGIAPKTRWHHRDKALENLLQLHLVNLHEPNGIVLHPALRNSFYRGLLDEQRWVLHLDAAVDCVQRGEFTAAAYHYLKGNQPTMAIWLWYQQRENEINQGQAGAAKSLFQPLLERPLPHPDDQKALALLLAALHSLASEAESGLAVLNQVAWTPNQPATALAQEWRGYLLAHAGEIEQAIRHFRQSIATVDHLRMTHTVGLHTQMGRLQLHYLRNLDQAQEEILKAHYELTVLQAEMAIQSGNTASARQYYQSALALVEQFKQPINPTRIHEGLGIIHAYHQEVEQAVEHLLKAGDLYRAYGNLVCAVGVTNTNLAYTYLHARRYAEAIAPAESALAFFANHPESYWIAANEAYLAEAHFHLGNLAQAEEYAERALRQEDVTVRPNGLYVLGQICRVNQQFAAAERLCREAIEIAEANQDPWTAASAWRALGETYRDWGKLAEARNAFTQLLALYQTLDVPVEIARSQALIDSLAPAT